MNSRRKFLKHSAALISIPTIVPASALGLSGFVAPSDRINVAFIGAGNQAENDIKGFWDDPRVQITAVCDVNKKSEGYWDGKVGGRKYITNLVNKHYKSIYGGQSGKSCAEFEDFREVISSPAFDAVEVVTPDHWHAIPTIMAARAGKHIYCQKPLALTIQEGKDMVKAIEASGITFQCGSQQRSNHRFRHVCELVRNGRIGNLKRVVCGLPGGTPDFGKTGDLTETRPVPKGFDYEMWLGPAPSAPYAPARTHVNFRWNLDYSGGMVTDWGGHHPDIAQWGMDMDDSGPIKVKNPKAKWADHPIWNTATEFYFECVYDNGVQLIITNEAKRGVTFEGSEGSLWVNRGDMSSDPAGLINSEIGADEIHLYKSDDHFRNFIDCILSGEEPIAPVSAAHRSITLAHLGNIAMQLEEDLEWDPAQEKVIGNEKANAMLSRPMRDPWDKVYAQLTST